jgi:hypothetical protein
MKFLKTDYNSFITEATKPQQIDYDYINNLKDRINNLDKKLRGEHDSIKRKKYDIQKQICQLKISLAQLH